MSEMNLLISDPALSSIKVPTTPASAGQRLIVTRRTTPLERSAINTV